MYIYVVHTAVHMHSTWKQPIVNPNARRTVSAYAFNESCASFDKIDGEFSRLSTKYGGVVGLYSIYTLYMHKHI